METEHLSQVIESFEIIHREIGRILSITKTVSVTLILVRKYLFSKIYLLDFKTNCCSSYECNARNLIKINWEIIDLFLNHAPWSLAVHILRPQRFNITIKLYYIIIIIIYGIVEVEQPKN